MSAESEIERKLDGPGPNTLIEYMYRDASNYKKTNVAVLKGRISLGQIGLIESSLNDGEFFIPGQVGLQDLQGEFEHGGGVTPVAVWRARNITRWTVKSSAAW